MLLVDRQLKWTQYCQKFDINPITMTAEVMMSPQTAKRLVFISVCQQLCLFIAIPKTETICRENVRRRAEGRKKYFHS